MAIAATNPGGSVVKSADRVLDLLELLVNTAEPLSFSEIATEVSIPRSSLSQLLRNLIDRGYVVFEADAGAYRLGPMLPELGARALAKVPIGQIIENALRRLRDELNEGAAFYVRRGDEVEVYAAVQSKHALVFTLQVGNRAPLYAISPGKIILSALTDEELEDYLARTKLSKLGPKTLVSISALRREIKQVRENGFATAFEELAAGICGYAVPVCLKGRLIGSINVPIPIVRADEALMNATKRALLDAKRRVEERLSGYEVEADSLHHQL